MVELINPFGVFLAVLVLIKVFKGVRAWRQNTKRLRCVVWDVREKKWKAAALKSRVNTSEK